MFKWLSGLLNLNEREIKKSRALVEQINHREAEVSKLKAADFKKRDPDLAWSFALAREASRRAINLRPFDEQLMAAICFHQGKIAEQKTGEGKTLSAVPALYLNALSGKGCHLVTVNDYLARRDAGWNGPIFDYLGISVSAIIHEQAYLFDPEFTDESAAGKPTKPTLPTAPITSSALIICGTTWSRGLMTWSSGGTILPLLTRWIRF